MINKFGDVRHESDKIVLDIGSLDRLVEELHKSESKDGVMPQAIALIIQHRLQLYYKHNFELDYGKYVTDIKKYFVE